MNKPLSNLRIGILLISPVFIILSMVIGGFIFLAGYNMLIRSIFTDLPVLSYSQSVMVSVFVGYLTYTPVEPKYYEDDSKLLVALITELIQGYVLRPLMWLAIFWIAVHIF